MNQRTLKKWGKAWLAIGLLLCCITTAVAQNFPRRDLPFYYNWKFKRGDASGAEQASYNDNSWDHVCLPHMVKLESSVSHGDYEYYHGNCWYRKSFKPDPYFKDKKVFIEFEAAMQQSEVWINGTKKLSFLGGYSPFTIDITDDLEFDKTNVIAIKLNNNHNSDVPPGNPKPDFYYYGGLYRYVNIHVMDKLHITDALYANKVAGGGIFVTYPSVSTSSATVQVKTHVKNEYSATKSCKLKTTILTKSGQEVKNTTTTINIPAGKDTTFTQSLTVSSPKLWHPDSPNLYVVKSEVFDDTRPADIVKTTIGIRKLEFSRANGMQINGKRLKTIGVNRHQDWGCIGNAVPLSGHYRDALLMKKAGVNFVRLSHYIQHPAFLDACDKLGMVVQACIPGWQYKGFSNSTWVNNSERDVRTMIRYYRNHPCVVMWEAIHNESHPPADFSNKMQKAAKEEFAGSQMFTCGQESNKVMDIYQAAVQQGGRKPKTGRVQGISEFGHWEYGGFTGTSNQPRSAGEKGMLKLAWNQTDAMSKNHGLKWCSFDAVWVWNDYFGFAQYVNSLCSGGVVDIFRIPKFSYYFFQSQRDPKHIIPNINSGPMVFIASHWKSDATLPVRVYSNCEKVSLYLNDKLISTNTPGNFANITHPHFTFKIDNYEAGTLKADGLINNQVVATHIVKTPQSAAKISVVLDTADMNLRADGSDLAVIYASITDNAGTMVPDAKNAVTFSVSGPGTIISGDGNPVDAVAGIASAYVQTKFNTPGKITVTATASGLSQGVASVTANPIPDTGATAIHMHYREQSASPQVTIRQLGSKILLVLPRQQTGKLKHGTFHLFTIQGKRVRTWHLGKRQKTVVSLENLASGMYYARVKYGAYSQGTKILLVEK